MTADRALAVLRSALDDAAEDAPEQQALATLARVVAAAHRAKAGPHGGLLPLVRLRDALAGREVSS